jgi:hypothetical protein
MGTENGSLKWSSFPASSFRLSSSFATKLDGSIITISADGESYGPDQLVTSLDLRVLDSQGDELDALKVRSDANMGDLDGSDFKMLLSLWIAAKSQSEASQAARLRPLMESLRAKVMAGSRTT